MNLFVGLHKVSENTASAFRALFMYALHNDHMYMIVCEGFPCLASEVQTGQTDGTSEKTS